MKLIFPRSADPKYSLPRLVWEVNLYGEEKGDNNDCMNLGDFALALCLGVIKTPLSLAKRFFVWNIKQVLLCLCVHHNSDDTCVAFGYSFT